MSSGKPSILHDSEDGTCSARVKKSAVTQVLSSVLTKKTTRPQKQKTVDLDAEETVAERVAELLTHQAGARVTSSPDNRKTIRQSPRLSANLVG